MIIGLIGCIIRASLPDRQSGRIQQLKDTPILIKWIVWNFKLPTHCRQHNLQHSFHKLVSSSPLQYSTPTSCLGLLMVRQRPLVQYIERAELVDVRSSPEHWQLKLWVLGSIPSECLLFAFFNISNSSHQTCCLLLVSLGVGSGNERDASSQTCMVCIKKNVNHHGHPEEVGESCTCNQKFANATGYW